MPNNNTRQTQIIEKHGYPTASELTDKRPEFRFIDGKGLYLVYKRNNIIYSLKMSVGIS